MSSSLEKRSVFVAVAEAVDEEEEEEESCWCCWA